LQVLSLDRLGGFVWLSHPGMSKAIILKGQVKSLFFFFITLGLEMSDTKVYEP